MLPRSSFASLHSSFHASVTSDESKLSHELLFETELPLKVSCVRWWILVTFSLLVCLQAATWNFYGPIFFCVREIYGWSDSQIAWVANAANISMLIAVPLTQYAVALFGARLPTLVSAGLMVACCVLRLVPHWVSLSDSTLYLVMLLSMTCNGAAAAWLNFGGPLLSAAWFPTTERTTATAVTTVMPYVGVSLGFVIGPLLMTKDDFPDGCGAAGDCPGTSTLHTLYWAQSIASVAVLGAIVIHFPALPATPPSHSAAITASTDQANSPLEDFSQVFYPSKEGRAVAVRLWVVALGFALPVGVYGGWGAVLAINLEEQNISSTAAGWLGCFMTLVGCVAGAGAGLLADRFRGHLKAGILGFYAIADVGFLLLLMIFIDVLPAGRVVLYTVALVGGLGINAPVPLFFELALETGFGEVGEGASSALISLLVTLVQIIFLGLSFIPALAASTVWMNWLMFLVLPAFMLPVAFMRVEYNRLQLDVRQEEQGEVKAGWIDSFGMF